jgi:hypothetical protein
VDRRTWRRPTEDEISTALETLRADQFAAAQLRWATEIVNLDDE